MASIAGQWRSFSGVQIAANNNRGNQKKSQPERDYTIVVSRRKSIDPNESAGMN